MIKVKVSGVPEGYQWQVAWRPRDDGSYLGLWGVYISSDITEREANVSEEMLGRGRLGFFLLNPNGVFQEDAAFFKLITLKDGLTITGDYSNKKITVSGGGVPLGVWLLGGAAVGIALVLLRRKK